jgi:ABC-2 type transport system permease protein
MRFMALTSIHRNACIGVAAVDPGMDSGLYTCVIDIPPDFQRDVLASKQPQVQVNIDATQMSQAFIGASYIQNIISGEINNYVQGYRGDFELPIELAVRVKLNPNLTSTWFGSVMEIINNITMLSIILTGAALISEREHGTLEHLLAMPLTPFEIMASKVWANGLVVLVATALSLMFIVQGLLQVPIAGSVLLFLFGAMLHLFSTTSLVIFLGTLARSMPQLGLVMILVILPLQMLSGGVTPRESMPEIVQNIMLFTPTAHFVSFAQGILYRGTGLDVVWLSFLAVIGIGAAFFIIALAMFRKTVVSTKV